MSGLNSKDDSTIKESILAGLKISRSIGEDDPIEVKTKAITVSFAHHITQSEVNPFPLLYVINRIRDYSDLGKVIQVIRTAPDQQERQRLKREHLPYFAFSGFKDGVRRNANFEDSKFIMLDIDHVGDRIDELTADLKEDRDVFLCFRSPSGDGVKVAFELERPVTTEEEFRAAFSVIRNKIIAKYAAEPDNDSDPARACYLSWDRDIYINPSPILQEVPSVKKNGQLSVRRTREEYLEIAAEKHSNVLKALGGSSSPGRTESAAKLIGHYIGLGERKEVTLEMLRYWNKSANTPPLDDEKLKYTVSDMYKRYEERWSNSQNRVFVRDGAYFVTQFRDGKDGEKSTTHQISNFTIDAEELLSVPTGGDFLTCTVVNAAGIAYKVVLSNEDWHARAKFLKAIGHQDCAFMGSDKDLQILCDYVNWNVAVRKEGSKLIGLIGNTWVVEGLNITRDGIAQDLSIVPYDKGASAFVHRIGYQELNDKEYFAFLGLLYQDIIAINDPNTLLPFLGWILATPLKPAVMNKIKSFPILFVHGSQGSGKTSTAALFMRLCGYSESTPYNSDMKQFPMLKLLSSTNAIPVFFDEFKKSDMREFNVDTLMRYIREDYNGEEEIKGNPDQTTTSYRLLAPMVVMGEWNINQPAIRERIIFPRFTSVIKGNLNMSEAFDRLSRLPLEAFMPRFIEYCLGIDLDAMLALASRIVEDQFAERGVVPRVKRNLTVMVLGLELFTAYGKKWGIEVPKFDLAKVLESQLLVITGGTNGRVQSAVDQLIEALIVFEHTKPELTDKETWITTTLSHAREGTRKCLAIDFKNIFPAFKEYARRTGYEGDLLDEESYKRMFDETKYIVAKDRPVKIGGKTRRLLVLDIEAAEREGVDLGDWGSDA